MTKIIPLFLFFLGSLAFGQTIIYSTDFQNGIPNDFTLIDNDLNTPAASVSEFAEAWICIADPDNNTDSVAASTSYFDTPDTADRWMITPMLELGALGNKFYWEAKSQDASFPDDYFVLISTTDNSTESFVDTVGYIQGENFEWTERNLDLSELGYDGQSIYVAFVLRTYDGFKLYIDDIEVVKDDFTGLNEQVQFSFNLFPVPVISTIHISSETAFSNITITDAKGEALYTGTENTIDVGDYPKGTYFVSVDSEKGTATKRFIKQ